MLMRMVISRKVLLLVCFLLASHITIAAWAPTGNGVDGTIRDMMEFNGRLYIAGDFDYSGTVRMDKVAYWDSNSWNALSTGSGFKRSAVINCLEAYQGQLVAAGIIDSVDGVRVSNIARFNGTTWEPIGMGFDNQVLDIAVYQDTLYACGEFGQSGSMSTRQIAKWDGVQWQPLASFIDNRVSTLAVCDTGLLIGGGFTRINSSYFSKTALYRNGQFYTVGQPIPNEVFRLKICDDTLYACGNFEPVPGNSSEGISCYYNGIWNPMPSPDSIITGIYDVVKFNQRLVVCGHFELPEDIGILEDQQYLPGGGTDGIVYRLIVYNNQLFAGGGFRNIDSISAMSIASTASFVTTLQSVLIEKSTLMVYPNPSACSEYVFVETLIPISPREIYLINSESKRIEAEIILIDPNKIRIKILEKGFYFLIVNNINTAYVAKIIIL